MLFEIHAEKNANDKAIFYYDNETNFLKGEDGEVFEFEHIQSALALLFPCSDIRSIAAVVWTFLFFCSSKLLLLLLLFFKREVFTTG